MKQLLPYHLELAEWVAAWAELSQWFIITVFCGVPLAMIAIIGFFALDYFNDPWCTRGKHARGSDEYRQEQLRLRFAMTLFWVCVLVGLYIVVYWFYAVTAGHSVAVQRSHEQAQLNVALVEATTESELLDLLASDFDDITENVLQHQLTSQKIQLYFSNHSDRDYRRELCARDDIIPDVLLVLAEDTDKDVRACVAAHTAAPREALASLLLDEEHSIALAAFQHPHTPLEDKCVIVQDILEGYDRYEQLQKDIGWMVDYCMSRIDAETTKAQFAGHP